VTPFGRTPNAPAWSKTRRCRAGRSASGLKRRADSYRIARRSTHGSAAPRAESEPSAQRDVRTSYGYAFEVHRLEVILDRFLMALVSQRAEPDRPHRQLRQRV